MMSVAVDVVELLVGYTPPANTFVNGVETTDVARITNIVRRSVADLIQALANSKVHEAVRLVGAVKADYKTTSDAGSDLSNLAAGTVGSLNSQRDAYGADLVGLLTDATCAGNLAGKAFQPRNTSALAGSGFAVLTIRDGFPVNFLHEVGHALGAGHAREATDPQSDDGVTVGEIRHAHDFSVTVGTAKLGTVMAGGSIPFFSNPAVAFRGQPSGVAPDKTNSADNAAAMNLLAKTVAGHKASVTTAIGDVAAYTFELQADQVTDTAGAAAPAGALLCASGNPLAANTPLLPRYAGPPYDAFQTDGRAAEQGDLADRVWRTTDFVSGYFLRSKSVALQSERNAYRFGLSAGATLKLKATTSPAVIVDVIHDAANTGNPVLLNPLTPQADGSFKLTAGGNYYLVVRPADSTKPGGFTLTASTL